LLVGVVRCTFDLVVVVVETDNVAAGELDHLSCGPTDTATDIQHSHAFLNADLVCEIVFVAGNGLSEWLPVRESAVPSSII
jgi:hypothetical protein